MFQQSKRLYLNTSFFLSSLKSDRSKFQGLKVKLPKSFSENQYANYKFIYCCKDLVNADA
jgi:hypothetical protein